MADRDPARLPQHVTTPLLTLITQQAVEEDYRQVAARRAAGDLPAEPRRTRVVAGAVIAVFGILVSVAAVQTSRNEATQDAGRATLIARIDAARSDLEAQQARIADLRRGNRRLIDALAALSTTSSEATGRLRRLQLMAGTVPATGPGVRVTVDDNPSGDPVLKVNDADLAKLVDGLWEAGAEAIAINNQRLTALSAIRNVGSAIHVNTVPLSPPYMVRAIGDPDTLQADLLNTTHGLGFFSLADQLGFQYTMEKETQLGLPGARPRRLRYVDTGPADQRGGLGIGEGP